MPERPPVASETDTTATISDPYPELDDYPHYRPYPVRPQPMRAAPRSARIALVPGVLSATLATGVVAAFLVPVDRPGLGWLLAGLATAGAVYTVDRHARRAISSTSEMEGGEAAADEATFDSIGAQRHTDDAPHADAVGQRRVSDEPDTVAVATGRGLDGPAAVTVVQGHGGDELDIVSADDAAASTGVGPSGVGTTDPGGFDDESDSDSARSANSDGEVATPAGVRLDARSRVLLGRIWWAGLALALLGVGVIRGAPWLFVLCVLVAGVTGSLAVVGKRSMYGLLFDALIVPFAATTVLPWLAGGVRRARGWSAEGSRRLWWSLAVTAGLLLVFVPLLAGADPVFADLVNGLVPRVDAAALTRWSLVFVVAGLGTAGALYVLAGPPPVAEGAGSILGQRVRRFSQLEWGIPVAALIVVFAAFLGTQMAVLFGGDGYVQRTAGLTYAEYARSGFWQLSIVSLLALAVIAAVLGFAAQVVSAERVRLRLAVAVLSVLTLVIVASALHRMWTYQQAYGFTVLRVLVSVAEVWIAVVYLLVLASLVRLDRRWVPRTALGAAAATLLVLAVLNPEQYVAERNIARWQSGRSLDADYLGTLSTDVLPAIDQLPAAERDEIATAVRARLTPDTWYSWNLSRARAH